MNERIKELRKNLNLTLEKFGKRLGVTKVTISNIENGNRNLTEQMLISICREFNVNENWLRNGEGEMFNSVPNSTMEQLRNEFHLDEFSFNLVYEYLKLPEEKRNVVRELFQNAISAEQTSTNVPAENSIQSNQSTTSTLNLSTEVIEEQYKKSNLRGASKTDATASNITEDIEKRKNIANK